ncbi:UDP-N-acetylmuramyl-tripeptide synthetase 2 [Ananas comosus]|uniref:UDP-N-acetylmuramyl-tripeptide synthetase 2 n=1 Tax=Ananas comosus TaxID=4615 RepID=A0A199VHF7_ANACO|nr:UDP-N-acetylmuramyl-tripeptide synthetase 2 [Ananas comosus]
MTLSELVNAAGIRRPVAVYGDPHVSVTGVQNDSRKVIPGDLFVCCVGCKTDGHLYIADAVRKGAVAVLSSKEVHLDLMPHCGALVVVQSTNSVLPVIAATFYKNPSRKMSVWDHRNERQNDYVALGEGNL